MSGVNKAKKIHGSESGYPAKISLTLPRTLAYEIVSEARHSRRSAEVIMQKLEQLFFDSVEGSRLPFFPAAIDPQLQRYVRLFRPIEPPAQSLKPRRSGQARIAVATVPSGLRQTDAAPACWAENAE